MFHKNPPGTVGAGLPASSLVRLRKSQNLAAIPDSLSAWAQEAAPTGFVNIYEIFGLKP